MADRPGRRDGRGAWWCRLGVVGLVGLIAGCTAPVAAVNDRIAQLGFSREIVTGTDYRHLLVLGGDPGMAGNLVVYVEHDGLPWLQPDVVSDDPTPRHPLALELMARDTGYRAYIGRPCYFGLQSDRGCSARSWTDARYADAVVRSMAAVVNRLVAQRGTPAGVTLVGYSGGGTIAWLMARHIPATTAVVTVAANLDVGAWTALHHFTPLTGSLDPAAAAPLPAAVRQLHLVGGRDGNVPPATVHAMVARQRGAALIERPAFDHVCCWLDAWPAIYRAALADAAN